MLQNLPSVMHPDVHESTLKQGNQALRQGDWAAAAGYYLRALQDQPGLSKSIAGNLAIARQKYRTQRAGADRQRVAVCGWELSHNAAGRVYTLAKLYEKFADVEMIGCMFPGWGTELWEPIRNTHMPHHSFVVHDESQFIEQAVQLVAAHPYEIVHLSKPRAPNIFFGILYKLIWGAKVLVDIDDEELAFVGADAPISLDDYLQQHGQLPGFKDLAGKDWTQLAVGLAKDFDGITVSNPALQQRYGGEIIRHARDGTLFKPSPELKRINREKFGIPQDKKVVLFFGTPREHKGLKKIVDLFLKSKMRGFCIVFVGDFEDLGLEKTLKKIEGIDLFFIKNKPFSVAPEVVAMGDIYILWPDFKSPISFYQTPAKLTDALAGGLTVFINEDSKFIDFTLHGAMIFFTEDNFSEKLSEIMTSGELLRNLKIKARKIFEDELDFFPNSQKLKEVLCEINLRVGDKIGGVRMVPYLSCSVWLSRFFSDILYFEKIKSVARNDNKLIKNTLLGCWGHDVIICVHNAVNDVDACIRSVLKNMDGLDNIIIINDYSGDETVRMLEGHQRENPYFIKIVNTPSQLGYTKSANIGLHQSTAKVRTLLNSDTIVTKNWAKKILRHLAADPLIGVLGPLSNAASHQSIPSASASASQTAINELPANFSAEDINIFCEEEAKNFDIPYVPLVHGFCMTITEKCIQNVGYFDENKFPKGYGEENDFCIRAQDAGFVLAIALDTYIFHAKSKSYSSEKRVQLMNDGWSNLVEKHGKRRLQYAIKTMENNPILIKYRKKAKDRFYKTEEIKNTDLRKMVMRRQADFGLDDKLKSIAFYLPQFHPTKENNANWGDGFTEWTNVVKAHPRFPGHFQPRLPGKLGFYDLRLPEIMTEQASMADNYGVSGFCFYYYRFGDKRVLDMPLDSYLKNKEARLPFCYCWANESWTRAWDGKTSDVLFQQNYDESTLLGFAMDIAEAIKDDRYIRINGRPVVLVYQVAEFPNPEEIVKNIRIKINNLTGENIFLGSVFSQNFKPYMLNIVDFVVQFPPHRIPRKGGRKTISSKEINPFNPERDDYYEAYEEVVKSSIIGGGLMEKMWFGVCPDWDNASRRQKNATTLIGSTPEKFENWVADVALLTRKAFRESKNSAPIIFINAWNEWAEGAVLEPSEKYGYQYLEAFKKGVAL